MKKMFYTLGILLPALALVSALSLNFAHSGEARASGGSCTATGFMRDGMNLTAAMIVTTTSFTVSGAVNAAGCNIGVYVGPGLSGTVTNAQVFGANYYGVVNNGSTVTVTNSQIHDIGENPLNGVQHGYGIYFTEDVGGKGSISHNLIWNYQKNGIVVRGVHSSATISYNTVIGQGPINFIAQNGIEVGEGARGSITNNTVSGNAYTGTGNAAAGGILIYGGSCYGVALTRFIKVTGNTLIGNDIGVYLSNLDGTTCIPTLTPTDIAANKNIITNDAVNNISGASPNPGGYQAGISDQGDGDTMNSNSICGLGYTPVTPPPYLYTIDITNTNNPTATGNVSCLDGSPITPSLVTPTRSTHPARGAKASSVTCTATGFYRDNMNLTAAVIVTTSGTTISGQVNAAGCNIGIYYGSGLTGTVNNAEVFGANYFGIVNNGSNVTISRSRIHDIGENPLNGTQHGVGIYFAYGAASSGKITNDALWNYQKGGIVVNGTQGTVPISFDTVIGQGPVNYIAQNGIQVGYGAKATVTNSIVTGNSYTGSGVAASGGILVVGGSCYGGPLTIGTKITGNTVIGNDVGVYLSNLDGTTCIPTNTPTNIAASKNILTNDAVNNTSGAGSGGYQAGISDQGDFDKMNNNGICGLGYTPVTNPPPYLYTIDITVTNNPTATGNTSCLDGSPVSPSIPGSTPHANKHVKPSSIR